MDRDDLLVPLDKDAQLDDLKPPYALFIGSIGGWKEQPPCGQVLFVRPRVTLMDLNEFLGVGVTAVNGVHLGCDEDVVVYLRALFPGMSAPYNAIADWTLGQQPGTFLGPAIICKGVTAS